MLSKIKFARSFPWWYTPVKWGIPLLAALLVGGTTGLLVTNTIAIPSMLSAFSGLSVFYQGLGSFSKLAFLVSSTSVASIFSGVVSAMLVRVGLFQYLETLAHDNLTGDDIFNKFLHEYEVQVEEDKCSISRQLSEYQQALIAAEQENRTLNNQQQYFNARLDQSKTSLPDDALFESNIFKLSPNRAQESSSPILEGEAETIFLGDKQEQDSPLNRMSPT